MDRLKTDETNPRGIPQAKFIEKIEDFIDPKTCTDDDVSVFLKELQVRLQQYQFMEENKRNTLNNLNTKIPDIKKTLDMCRFLKSRKEHDEETIDVNYELNDTVYSTAEINVKELDSVSLWLGADIMMEYPIDEAIEMLEKRLQAALDNKAVTVEDLEYLRSNITTMEVNTARVYNWDVQRRKALKAAETTS
ncbi:Prefoldin subunit 3 [Ogataea parapolymorpha DL-1]|uniref:Prefoldin subunit 3 n=1 Tax=Ogataea parapolymorpha (strain ATCC 26012 / BCRC 20466 / JCM 22074 / NRRL Y-7560 / DL-1) TaxID=871575 RepID=W1QL41_OGAPD|nr:Prefoldin subunit 3 [Ogataea parapolymorpha DL-1]ESX01896.1 Prefoldin subunit 3 [Ogataea parapolymorpha DL-1]